MKKYLSLMIQVMLVMGVVFMVAVPQPTSAAPIELVFIYHAPPQASLTKAILEPWANDIEAAAGGKIKITRHPGGTMVKGEDSYDAIATGLADIAQIDPEETPGRFPLTSINGLPFFYPDTVTAGVVSHQLLNKYCVNSELKEIKLMIMAPLHMQQYLGRKKVETLVDFKGMKLRSSGKVEAETVKALGAVPVEVGTGELAAALDKRVVDGCFFTLAGSLAFGLKDVTQYRTICNIIPRVFFIGMNKGAYNRLPAEVKKVFDQYSGVEATRKYAAAHAAMEKGAQGAIMGYDKKVGNPPFVMLSKAERNNWKAAAKSVWDEWLTDVGGKGLPAQAMMDDAVKLLENAE